MEWCRLSIFPGDFDRNGAAAALKTVCDYSAQALSDLVKWSLIAFIPSTNSEDGRYKLHDLARLFAESRLKPNERADVQKIHAEYYLGVLSKARELYIKGNENTLVGLELFDREMENILSGQSWAESMIHSAENLNSTIAGTDSFLHLASYYPITGAAILDLRLHPCLRIHWLETGLIAAEWLKDRFAESVILFNMGRANADLGETQRAIEHFEKALTISREIGNRYNNEANMACLITAYSKLSEKLKAIELYEQALTVARELKDHAHERAILSKIGMAYFELGEIPRAIKYLNQALAVAQGIGDEHGEMSCLGNIGIAKKQTE